MRCPRCQDNNTKVIDSRPVEENTSIRRRRLCTQCDFRFTTFERVEKMPLLVIKRDGTREEFSKEKLLRGLVRSCEKRPIALETLEEVVKNIESEIRQKGQNEVPSTLIGEMVMDILPKIDEVAYIRYASVYRHFEDPTVFLQEIEQLKQMQKNNAEGQTNLDLEANNAEEDQS
ncbi:MULTISPECIES: transcriptional regulator NrdR [Aerococcus]|uniref:Transcriptional repressor NrdR n=1 Tax=Aerococcus tenax TaxID=3078812 RepID=A0A5N1BRG4_9LACT|nr:transcriptional regulator NrdR [Aerococcus urinae]KAA9242707.1 transcriptional regulator NrdR [Aerococcus urinae]MDK6370897.1 transcriptional regulator NrdR [Aerococcus urinae]MDK6597268.1 transcriptional regulator NrdR [Aerococcus urinae]MDK7301896.1 transcriptional regulator NrdR [Aerococcus urinae]MDK7801153.1 transcriptional regulator NrdR [Aerococcus urinae]